MSIDQEPPRLLDDPELGAAMRLLVSDEPTPATDARISQAIANTSLHPTLFSWARVTLGMTVVATLAFIGWKAWEHERPRASQTAVARPSDEPLRASSEPAPSEAALEPTPIEEPSEARSASDETLINESSRRSSAQRAARPSEEDLILEARRALRTNPSLTENRLSVHRRLYPNGLLAEEREALRIELLIDRGDHERARRALDRIRRDRPDSAHVARLERLLGTM